jgi:D-alanyl-lipoteichoic acid acyltransferase DltB (MBOAT superfamily)
MSRRQRLGRTFVLVLWIAFAIVVLVSGWHGIFVLIGAFVAALALVAMRRPGSSSTKPARQGPWPDKAPIAEFLRRRRRKG